MSVRFDYLLDHPEAVPTVARWWFDAWGPTANSPTPEALAAGLRRDLHRDALPMQIVGIEADEVIGVAVLKEHEMQRSYPELRHWLGNVYVRPDARQRGVASALAKHVAGLAHGMGIRRMHLATDRLDGGLYSRCGYEPLERAKKGDLDVLVMAYDIDAPVRLAAYDARWSQRFEEEKALLEEVLAPWLVGGVEHIGSTAVPGLVAKPVIDVMAGVETLSGSRGAIPALAERGYVYFPYRVEIMHWLCKPSLWKRTHHLHLVPFESPLWTQRLAFRDRLRGAPALAAEYAELKERLAREHEFDREAYTDGKEPFVRRVVEETLGPGSEWAR